MKILNRIFTQELPYFFACPALLWQLFFLYLPLLILLGYSFLEFVPDENLHRFTFKHYTQVFDSLYFNIIINSFITAVITALICLMIAFPVAYFLAMKVTKRYRTFLLISIILPSWTSLIVQIYAWFFMLEKNGHFSQLLYKLRIISPTTTLLNSYFSILVGMVGCFLPFMILPIYAVLERMDKTLIEASADLGGDRFETLRRVIIPLTRPGIYAGLLLVIIPAFGEFAIPTILGGSKRVFWGNLIVEKFLRSRNWAAGAAVTNIGIMLPILVIGFLFFLSRMISIYRNRGKQQQTVYKEPW